MTIAFNSVLGASAVATGVTSHTFAFTNVGGDIAFVGDLTDAQADTITGITYNGIAMTRVNTTTYPDTGFARSYLYYLLAPATGANNVVISFSSSRNSVSYAWSYSGAKQEAPEANNTANGNSTTPSVSFTSVTNQAWATAWEANDSGAFTPDSGVTKRAEDDTRSVAVIDRGPISPAGASTLSGTIPSAFRWVVLAAVFSPAPEIPKSVRFIPRSRRVVL